jgi:LL-diaminopimelate aminotransferase
MIVPADRITHIQPYFYAGLSVRIRELEAAGKEIIRMDMGSPDLAPPEFILDVLTRTAADPTRHGYTNFGGIPAYKSAWADYYAQRFGVDLDPVTQVLGLIGSKEGIFALSQVLVNPGDVVLVPSPGYSVYLGGAKIAGAEIVDLPLLAENHFLPDLSLITSEQAQRAKILWINYPNNPTGAVAPFSFFEDVVAFGRRHDILIAHDSPYAEISYGEPPRSILEVAGAAEVAVEFNSLSKTYNMAGWRMGALLGNADVVRMMLNYKSQADSGHFAPVLAAGIAALSGDQSWLQDRNAIYKRRVDVLVGALEELGLEPVRPAGALYVWARTPQGQDDYAFCTHMLTQAGVSLTPGPVYGQGGRGYFRMSVCIPEARISQAIDKMAQHLRVGLGA